MAPNPFAQFAPKKEEDEKNPFAQFGRKKFEKKSEFESLLSGVGDSLTFGWGDELLGLGAGVGAAFTGGDFGKAMDETTAWSRAQQKAAAQDNGLWYGGGQVLGAIGGGFGLGAGARLGLGALGQAGNMARLAGNVGATGRIGTAAATGALGGSVYGAGAAEDDKVGGALEGAAWGAALGGGMRAIGEPIGQVYRSVVKPAFNADYRAARMMGKTLDRFGSTPQKFQDALDAAPANAMAMDVVPGGTQIVMGAGTRVSAGKDAMRDALDARNNSMADETADSMWESVLGKKYRVDAGKRILDLKTAKKAITYDDIDQLAIDPTNHGVMDFLKYNMPRETIEVVDNNGVLTPVVKKVPAEGKFASAVEDTIAEMKLGDPLATPGGMREAGRDVSVDVLVKQPEFWRKLWTRVREDVDTEKIAAKTSGKGLGDYRSMSRDSAQFRRELGTLLGPKWEAKQSVYKALNDEEKALRMGYDALDNAGDIKLGDFLDEMNQQRNRFRSPAAKEQFDQWVKQGALARVEDMMNKADTQTGRADVLRTLIGNKSKIQTLNHIVGRSNKDGTMDMRYGFAKLLPKLEEQRGLFENSVKSGIGVNSHTADKLSALAAQQAQTGGVGGIRGMVMKGLTGDIADEFDEKVSNNILAFMQKPAAQLKAEIARAGGVENWMQSLSKNELLALAMQAQKPEFRRKALGQAALGGVYSNIGGDALLTSAGMGQ